MDCRSVKRLSAVDPEVLEQSVRRAHDRAVQEAAEPASAQSAPRRQGPVMATVPPLPATSSP